MIEKRPANNPQTNGVSKRFNQTLILKICYLLAQSSVPLTFWDEVAQYALMLINNLPSKALHWNCPMGLFEDSQFLIEPRRDFGSTIPFGLKFQIYWWNNTVPVSDKQKYWFLGYEQFSDLAHFWISDNKGF